MSLFVIEAVRFNAAHEQVEQVRWGKVRGGEVSPPVWAAAPTVVDVIAVIDAINTGDEVMTIFTVAGDMVFGPEVHVVTYDDGSKGIETDNRDIPERTLRDLPGF